jgi:hypothetical protein
MAEQRDVMYAVHMIKHKETVDSRGKTWRAYDNYHDLDADLDKVRTSAELYTQTSFADEIYIVQLEVVHNLRVK